MIEKYTKPNITVIETDAEDVITSSIDKGENDLPYVPMNVF